MSKAANDKSEPNRGGARRMILFAVLALLLVALAYDYGVARAGVETAYNKIVDRSAELNADSTKKFTNEDVRTLLGREPSRVFQDDDNGDTVEVFSWQSGVPFKTHDLFAVYKPNDGDLMFYRHAKFKYESSGDVSPFNVATIIEVEEGYTEDGDGGGGDEGTDPAGGGGGPGGGGGSWNPEAMFAENDANGDGVWTDDEIPSRARENMDDIDTDGDGAVSKDEWMARAQAMRGGRGGGQGRGGEGRPAARSRPEMEEDSTDAADSGGDPYREKPATESAVSPANEKPANEKPASEESAGDGAKEPSADASPESKE